MPGIVGIFGANGFIGRKLAQRLIADGFRVRAVSRQFDADFEDICGGGDRLECVTAELEYRQTIEPALEGVETVFQLMSSTSPGLGNDQLADTLIQTVPPHIEFMNSCRRAGVSKLVFISSGGTVYGRPEKTPIPESHPCNPLSAYGLSKLVIEKYLHIFREVHGLNSVIVRLSNPIGPGQIFRRGQGLVPAIISRYQDNEPVTVFGDGSAQRDYIYIDDVTEALSLIAQRAEVTNTLLNIGSGEGRSIMDVIAAINLFLDRELTVSYLPARSTDVNINVLDISKARDMLGWSPQTPFEEGIRRAVDSLISK